jgi:hypothetical protein
MRPVGVRAPNSPVGSVGLDGDFAKTARNLKQPATFC